MPDHNTKSYIKDQSFDPIYRSVNFGFYFKSRVLPGVLMGLGFLILFTQVVVPLAFFKTQDKVSKPVTSTVLGIATGFGEFEFKELAASNSNTETRDDEFFYLTIPKLKINEAAVKVNSPTLKPDDYIGHYTGSALPGENGNTFLFGHSVLPWFYNPKNYKTIFSTLDQLRTDDELTIEYKGKSYRYKVEYGEVLATDTVQPLGLYKPAYLNESTLTLMTCYPMGTKAKRYLIRAILIERN